MAELIANLDYVAVLRDRRKDNEPDPVSAAVMAELAGAGAISLQLRADRRFIQERDVKLLREVVKTRLHLVLAPTKESVKAAYAVKPQVVTLVPERQDEVSSSIGIDVLLNQANVKQIVRALREVGVKVALLVDPEPEQVKAAQACEADAVMLNARLYADTARDREARDEREKLATSAKIASRLNLRVWVGHGLDYTNVSLLARIPEIEAFEVGHALIARAAYFGIERAVREMRMLLAGGAP